MTEPINNPIPYPDLPTQPKFDGWCTNWGAYDVPRIWNIIEFENDSLGWEQVNGLRQLGDLLVEHYRRLIAQHNQLAMAWQGPAANQVLSRVEAFAKSLLSDAYCATTTAKALHAIMETYADAQIEVSSLMEGWNKVTTDWLPEWWDHAAEMLNEQARRIMRNTDEIVRDHRSNIIIPDRLVNVSRAQGEPIVDDPHTAEAWVPPVPGYDPVSSSDSEATLASLPRAVDPVPGQAGSLLPIPPGNMHAPYGGAYLLPGPGTGNQGYIIAMPHPSNRFGGAPSAYYPGTSLDPFSSAGPHASVSGGVVPITMGSPPSNGNQPGPDLPRKPPNTKWELHHGGPPILHGVDDDTYIPNAPSRKQQDEFKDWLAQITHSSHMNRPSDEEPQIILRKAR